MIELQDVPESDGDEEEEDEDEEEEVTKEREAEDDKQPEEFDEEAFQKQMSDRLEAMRINKALGNDDPDDVQDEESESESESEESDDSDSGDSIGPTPTEFSSFDQNRKKRPARVARPKGLTRADELKLTVAQQVGKERESKEKRFHSKKSISKAGNAKGHKWKNSEAFQVGKNSGW
jgi:RIO kinase 2